MSSTDAAGDAGAAANRRGFLKRTLVESLLVTVLGAAAGAGSMMINPPPSPSPASAGAVKPDARLGATACGGGTISMLELPPVVTNIGSPVDTWVRMEASIVFDPKVTPHPEIMAAEIATDELAYLRTISLTQIQGPIGLENIRQDLTDRAEIRSGGKVTEFILRTLVVQ